MLTLMGFVLKKYIFLIRYIGPDYNYIPFTIANKFLPLLSTLCLYRLFVRISIIVSIYTVAFLYKIGNLIVFHDKTTKEI